MEHRIFVQPIDREEAFNQAVKQEDLLRGTIYEFALVKGWLLWREKGARDVIGLPMMSIVEESLGLEIVDLKKLLEDHKI